IDTSSPAPSDPADASTDPADDAAVSGLSADEGAAQVACRDYMASRWDNATYPAEREIEWAFSSGEGLISATWKLAEVPNPTPGESARDYAFDCTFDPTSGEVIEL